MNPLLRVGQLGKPFIDMIIRHWLIALVILTVGFVILKFTGVGQAIYHSISGALPEGFAGLT